MAVASDSLTSRTSADEGDTGGRLDLVGRRVLDAVEVADDFQAQLELETLVHLLPEDGPSTAEAMAQWVRAHPAYARLDGSRVVSARGIDSPIRSDRRLRAEQYFRAAEWLIRSDLRISLPWLRFAGVTGSTAYGEPTETDDCDLMAVVRPGMVWLFLAYAFLRLRLRRRVPGPFNEPQWCLNYVLDDRAARREYSRARGFLFAREALLVRPVSGEAYYRGLLTSSDWLRREAPRLYARWDLHPGPAPPDSPPSLWIVRALNAIVFPVLAAYLQCKGLWTNHRLTATGREEQAFRTVTRLDRMVLATRKFERLASRWASASRLNPE